MTKTTHRPSFEDPRFGNCFWSEDQNGAPTFDGHRASFIEIQNMPDEIVTALDGHALDGSHPECVICQANARREWQAEAEAQAADARDLLDTYRSAL